MIVSQSVGKAGLRRRGRLLPIFLVMLLGACVAPEVKKDVVVDGVLLASDNVNPDLEGRGAPVVVRVYQLEVPGKFSTTDFFPLFDAEQVALGASLVSRDELQVTPGGETAFSFLVEPGARFLGVVAAFRDIDHANWRGVVKLPEGQERIGVQVLVRDRTVSVSLR